MLARFKSIWSRPPRVGRIAYRQVFENAPVGLAIVGRNGEVLRANARICEILKREEGDLRSGTFVDFTHPDDAMVDAQLFKQLDRNEIGSYQIRKRYLCGDGSIVDCLLSVSKVEDGPLYFMIGAVADPRGS